MITVKFYRIYTKTIQQFENVLYVTGQLQETKDAHYLVRYMEKEKGKWVQKEAKIPMNDSYVNNIF